MKKNEFVLNKKYKNYHTQLKLTKKVLLDLCKLISNTSTKKLRNSSSEYNGKIYHWKESLKKAD